MSTLVHHEAAPSPHSRQPGRQYRRQHRRTAIGVLLAAILCHLLLFAPIPLWVQSWAACLLAGWLPATLLLTHLLPPLKRDPVSVGERALYIIGVGYGIIVLVMLGLSYIPGAIPRWAAFIAFDLLLMALGFLLWRGQLETAAQRPTLPLPRLPLQKPLWLFIGLLVLAVVGGFLRFPDLGYAEFQGDEARAMLRAAEVIEGFDGSLFEHRKGPTEILLPAAPYVLIGHIDEAAARIPFAFANFCGLFAIFLLGWRWFGPLAGWVAAMLLAVDGYLIAFSRIVQYQSIIFLTVVLVLLLLQRLVQSSAFARADELASTSDADTTPDAANEPVTLGPLTQPRPAVYFTLASFLLATGLLSHYEAILVVIPALLLLWQLWRGGLGLDRIAVALVPAVLVGGAMLAIFYIPFVRYPTFGNTFEYLAYKRIGEELTYNNLSEYFIRSTLYSSTYAFLFMTLLALAGLLIRYRRGLGRYGRWLGAFVMAGLALTFWLPHWLTIAGQDFTWLFFVLALGIGVLMPDRKLGERAAWLWFAGVLVLAIFFTATPNTHVYNFYFGWALVAGLTVQQLWQWFNPQHPATLRWLTIPIATLLILIFGYYQYSLFIRNDVEVLRTWPEHRPPGYWTAYDTPIASSIFGFPHRNGWKTVSVLAAEGVIDGAFDTNTKDWIVDWYSRGLGSCPRDHRYFVLADKVEPTEAPARADLLAQLEDTHELVAVVDIQGQERLRVYAQVPADGVLALPEVLYLDAEEQAAIFDRTLSQPQLVQSGPVVAPAIAKPLQFRLGDTIELVGYTLHNQEVSPGGEVQITLYWRALAPVTQRYTTFVQFINVDDARKAGQRDGEPVCGKYPTVDWRPGEIIADRYYVPVDPDAPFGTYGLLVGMYPTEPADGGADNLTFYSRDGQSLGGSLSIDEIYVQPLHDQQAQATVPK